MKKTKEQIYEERKAYILEQMKTRKTKVQIAKDLGFSRCAFYRCFNKMKKEGYFQSNESEEA